MDLIKKICAIIGIITLISSVIYMTSLKFTNPDMTDMRLLLTYWPNYIIGVIIGISGYALSLWSIK